jgi:hypothetical protein
MILTAAECKLALGLTGAINSVELSLIESFLPKVNAAITKKLRYNPEYRVLSNGEYYPTLDLMQGSGEGAWEVAGGRAHFAFYGRSDVLQLRNIPVRSIEEIRIDSNGGFGQKPNTFGASTVKTAGTDYYQDLIQPYLNQTGHVYALGGFPSEPGSVLVKYTCGYTRLELDGRADADITDAQTGRAGSEINASGIKTAAELTLIKAFKTYMAQQKSARAGWTAGQLTSERMGAYSYSVGGGSLDAITGMKIDVPPEAEDHLQPFQHYGLLAL